MVIRVEFPIVSGTGIAITFIRDSLEMEISKKSDSVAD